MTQEQVLMLEAEADRDPAFAIALLEAETIEAIERLANSHGIEIDSGALSLSLYDGTDLADSELEEMNAGTSYSKNCPTYRTCGAASPCVRTC